MRIENARHSCFHGMPCTGGSHAENGLNLRALKPDKSEVIVTGTGARIRQEGRIDVMHDIGNASIAVSTDSTSRTPNPLPEYVATSFLGAIPKTPQGAPPLDPVEGFPPWTPGMWIHPQNCIRPAAYSLMPEIHPFRPLAGVWLSAIACQCLLVLSFGQKLKFTLYVEFLI